MRPVVVHALHRVSFDVPRGELVALKGRSGSGRTTLLNLVGGLDAETGLAVMELLRAVVRSEQVTALVATYDAALLDLADRVPELSDGEIVEH
ncbi:hypothetical protein GCM10023080_048410 [Streptomyces pseudoechinosporeus]